MFVNVFFTSRAKGKVIYRQCDLKSNDETESLAKDALKLFPGGVDVLVNNAGLFCYHQVH